MKNLACLAAYEEIHKDFKVYYSDKIQEDDYCAVAWSFRLKDDFNYFQEHKPFRFYLYEKSYKALRYVFVVEEFVTTKAKGQSCPTKWEGYLTNPDDAGKEKTHELYRKTWMLVSKAVRLENPISYDKFIPSSNSSKSPGKLRNAIASIYDPQESICISHKLARICWNTRGWKTVSGPEGKSQAPNSYEYENGFGHEEWLFDKSRIIDGYHYAFLEQLRLKSNEHVGKTYNISLFTTLASGNKYYVGKIRNAKCISKEESAAIYKIYKKKNWLSQMIEDVMFVNGKSNALEKTRPEMFFNLKFRFMDLELEKELVLIHENDKNIKTSHMVLLTQNSPVKLAYEEINDQDSSEGNLRNTQKRKVVYRSESEIDPYHNKMQNAVYKILKKSSEYASVGIEKNRVDLRALTHDGRWHYYEIKTKNSRISIRQALGQIMEYAYWPDEKRASKLIVVSDDEPDEEAITYLRHIRAQFKIPIFYSCFDFNENKLSKQY